ncbi:hypothetical protein VW37_004200 [Salmonella enterica subsp. houtenae serovar 51:z4,z23:-]|nr:hypothetical protein [Salmonella enterica subsp. houtenae serovar 51:z4,z23:-]
MADNVLIPVIYMRVFMKILWGILIVVVIITSFEFGRRWEQSLTAEYCTSTGKKISDAGPLHCMDK